MMRRLLLGAAAGAAGTTALNALTYADMTWRARPASTTPEKTVEQLAAAADLEIPGEGEERQNRLSALGALSGILTGVGVGAVYGLVRTIGVRPPTWLAATLLTAGAMAGSNGPMTVLGITDPRTWSPADWVSDVVPHVGYGIVAAATVAAADRRR